MILSKRSRSVTPHDSCLSYNIITLNIYLRILYIHVILNLPRVSYSDKTNDPCNLRSRLIQFKRKRTKNKGEENKEKKKQNKNQERERKEIR